MGSENVTRIKSVSFAFELDGQHVAKGYRKLRGCKQMSSKFALCIKRRGGIDCKFFAFTCTVLEMFSVREIRLHAGTVSSHTTRLSTRHELSSLTTDLKSLVARRNGSRLHNPPPLIPPSFTLFHPFQLRTRQHPIQVQLPPEAQPRERSQRLQAHLSSSRPRSSSYQTRRPR
jgi:hypothetical protein